MGSDPLTRTSTHASFFPFPPIFKHFLAEFLYLAPRHLCGRGIRPRNVRGCICRRGRGTSRDRASALGRGAGRVCKQASQTEVRICSPGSRRLWSSSPSRVFIEDAPHFPHPHLFASSLFLSVLCTLSLFLALVDLLSCCLSALAL